jgi:hypothetical protein
MNTITLKATLEKTYTNSSVFVTEAAEAAFKHNKDALKGMVLGTLFEEEEEVPVGTKKSTLISSFEEGNRYDSLFVETYAEYLED